MPMTETPLSPQTMQFHLAFPRRTKGPPMIQLPSSAEEHYRCRSTSQCFPELYPWFAVFFSVLKQHLIILHSLGSSTHSAGLHWRSNRHRDLVQSRLSHLDHLWYILCRQSGMVSSLEENVHRLGAAGPVRLEWRR